MPLSDEVLALLDVVRDVIDNSEPRHDGREQVCSLDLDRLERAAVLLDPTFAGR